MMNIGNLYPKLRKEKIRGDVDICVRSKRKEKRRNSPFKSTSELRSLRLSSESVASELSEMKSVRKMLLCKQNHKVLTKQDVSDSKPPFKPANPPADIRREFCRLNEDVPYDSAERHERKLYELSKSKWLSPKGFMPTTKNVEESKKNQSMRLKSKRNSNIGHVDGVTKKIMKKIGRPPKINLMRPK